MTYDYKVYKKKALEGSKSNQYNVGVCYLKGDGISKNIGQAIYWFTLSARRGYPKSAYELGCIYKDAHNIEQAIYWFEISARFIKESYIELAFIYKTSPYQDKMKSFYWFKRAAEIGYAEAQYQLGIMYKRGIVVFEDEDNAIYWLSKAYFNNHLEAAKELDVGNIKGNKLNRIICNKRKEEENYIKISKTKNKYGEYSYSNLKIFYTLANKNHAKALYIIASNCIERKKYYEALKWLMPSAALGYEPAQYWLSGIYNCSYKSKYKKLSEYWMNIAGNQDYSPAKKILSEAYEKGSRYEKNIKKAIYWHTILAKENDIDSLIKLGDIYFEGVEIKRNLALAESYYREASFFDITGFADYKLGNLYLEKNEIHRAIHYFINAASYKDKYAAWKLSRIYRTKEFEDKELELFWLKKSADNGFAIAELVYGVKLYRGEEIPKDKKLSLSYIMDASKQGYTLAKLFFEQLMNE